MRGCTIVNVIDLLVDTGAEKFGADSSRTPKEKPTGVRMEARALSAIEASLRTCSLLSFVPDVVSCGSGIVCDKALTVPARQHSQTMKVVTVSLDFVSITE